MTNDNKIANIIVEKFVSLSHRPRTTSDATKPLNNNYLCEIGCDVVFLSTSKTILHRSQVKQSLIRKLVDIITGPCCG
jgi:hypothetical protein